MTTSHAVHDGTATPDPFGIRELPFVKMTGSGNDFVFFDGRVVPIGLVTSPEVIRAICNRYNGIGADGLVVLEPSAGSAQARIAYFNSDGTPADLCGNATLCSTTLAVEIGLGPASGMLLSTPSGDIRSRFIDGIPEIELQPLRDIVLNVGIDLVDAERRIGFAVAGIPHLVVLCENADVIDVAARGPILRHHPAVGPAGANVNWVSPKPDGGWRYRTFERGVEGETLACGTGAVATAALLATWGADQRASATISPSDGVIGFPSAQNGSIRILTSSGRRLDVTLTAMSDRDQLTWIPTLRGEGRVVFRGRIATLIG